MPKLSHTGPENEGPKSGRMLGNCKKTDEEQSLIGKLGVGQGKRLNSGGGAGKGKRLQYNKNKLFKGN